MRTGGNTLRRRRAGRTLVSFCVAGVLSLALMAVTGCITPEPEPRPEPTPTATSTATSTPEVTPSSTSTSTATPTVEPTLTATATSTPTATRGPMPCVGFEGLPVGTQYVVPERFMESDVEITVRAFQWGNGQWTTDGYAEVDDQGLAGGSGQDMWINNVNLDFDFCCGVDGLALRFGEYGGNLNIEINGIFANFADFADIDGTEFDGVWVTVTDGLGNDTGTLTLKGEIWSFALGGQELWIDDVCRGECLPGPEVVECVDFEDPPLGEQYHILDSFQDSGAVIRVAAFQWGTGDWTTGGYAEVADGGLAGGSGQEMWINNVNLDFKLPRCPLESLVLRFGEYGGNVNLYINEEFKESDDLMDFDGQVIGGVEVRVVDGQENAPAKMELKGEIRSFAIGGQELAIDDVCPWVE